MNSNSLEFKNNNNNTGNHNNMELLSLTKDGLTKDKLIGYIINNINFNNATECNECWPDSHWD